MFIKKDKIYIVSGFLGFIIILFIMYPILYSIFTTNGDILISTLWDDEVIDAIWTSFSTATITTIIAMILGVPFSYFLARNDFYGKKVIEGIIDIPVVIPQTVVGIMLLAVFSKQSWFGGALYRIGFTVIGTKAGIVMAMLFTSMPLLINASKDAFLSISPKIENVSRSLGASHLQTFIYITLSMGWRGILTGMILTWARAVSGFGAVIILTYHPMIAPTLIFDRLNSFGLEYSKPISSILMIVSLIAFIILRMTTNRGGEYDRN